MLTYLQQTQLFSIIDNAADITKQWIVISLIHIGVNISLLK